MIGRAVALVWVVGAADAWPPHIPTSAQAWCPNQQCRLKDQKRTSLIQLEAKLDSSLREPQVPLPLKTEAERPHNDKVHKKDPDTGVSMYNLEFKSGHFVCSKCDTGSCPSCNTVCDLASCMGEFYTQECWCRKDSQVKLETPEYWFRQYDARFLLHDTVKRGFCDEECSGGICDMPGLQCKRREEACKPWWWCNLDPPASTPTPDKWPTGFEYTTSMTFLQETSEEEPETTQPEEEPAAAFLQRSTAHVRRSGDSPEFEENDYGKFTYETGSWECGQAGLPPKVQDPKTFLWKDRGYIVFDSTSCQGGAFDHKCFCYDEFEYLKGNDPKTSELHCNAECTLGPCSGNTCGSSPPPPPTKPPPPPPLDPVQMEKLRSSELKTSNNKMDPMTT